MNIRETIQSKKWLKILLISLAVLFFLSAVVVGSSLAFNYTYQNKIFPGAMVNGYDLGGLTVTQAENIILSNTNLIYDSGFTFIYNEDSKTIPIGGETPIFTVANSSMAQKAFNLGRQGNVWKNYYERFMLLIKGIDLNLEYQFNREVLDTQLRQAFTALENPAQDSQVTINVTSASSRKYELSFSDAADGKTFQYAKAIEQLKKAIDEYQNPKISLLMTDETATVTKEMAMGMADDIDVLLKLEPIVFSYTDKEFDIKWEDYSHWIEIKPDGKNAKLNLNQEMVGGQLESFGQKINQEPRNAKFQMTDGKVTEFQASQNGLEIDKEASYAKINDAIVNKKEINVELIVKITPPEINIESINALGITELIGVGQSNFSGSPTNRRRNIGVGSATLNGLLIKPGEEFSLVTTLGDIDASTGYYPELVIKGNKTIPEYGGGLCQVATTLFRVVLDAGLPITEREEHSYRVSYYEPAGTDATIYQPHPDLRFVNDTGNYILIQTFVEGDSLRFEFWGKSDGRKVEQTKPAVFNITVPGPTKLIDSTELEPGVKKCTERAHNGADAVFYRTITKADGTEIKEEWRSHYVPWQAVCLVGVDTTATPTTDAASTTPTVPAETPVIAE
jgi:vancomycin resistance protein YoaR